MKLIFGTFLFSIASALLPVLNLEAYLAVVAAELPHLPLLWLAFVGGAGQVLGKIVWFLVGHHSLKIRWIRRKMEKPKWQASYTKWEHRIHGRPWMAGLVCLGSAVSGFPPMAVVSVLAGSLRMSFPVFVVTCLVGRTIRFWLVLAGVGVLFGH